MIGVDYAAKTVASNSAGRQILATDSSAPSAMIAANHQAVPIRRIPLASGDAGIAQTVQVMHSLIDGGAVDPQIREQALGIVRQAGAVSRDASAEINAIFWWAKTHMRFQKDVSGGEYVCTPRYLLRTMAGDCDDYVVLLGALIKSLGIPIRITTIAADREEPGRLSHVYLEAMSHGQWIPLDATQDHSYPGWQPPRYFRKKVWESAGLKTGATPGLAGLGQNGDDAFATDISALTPFIGTAEQGVAQIVSAENQPQVEYVMPTTTASDSAFSLTGGVGGSASPLIIIAVVLALVFAMKK
jgi:predicted transglutaminase-like cysteine proteinase